LRLSAYAIAVSLAAKYLRPDSLRAEIGMGLALLAVFIGLVWSTILHADDRRAIANFASDRTRAIAARLVTA
jgi:hypothetical protein